MLFCAAISWSFHPWYWISLPPRRRNSRRFGSVALRIGANLDSALRNHSRLTGLVNSNPRQSQLGLANTSHLKCEIGMGNGGPGLRLGQSGSLPTERPG